MKPDIFGHLLQHRGDFDVARRKTWTWPCVRGRLGTWVQNQSTPLSATFLEPAIGGHMREVRADLSAKAKGHSQHPE